MSLRIATFTDHLYTPSSRFRMRQYFPYLNSEKFELYDYYRKYSTETASSVDGTIRIRHSLPLIFKALFHETANICFRLHDVIDSNKYDAIWLSRQLIIGYPTFEKLFNKPLIYDIDDAIYLKGKAAYLQFKITASKSSVVIAGNNFLAEESSKYCRNVHVVPTAVDTSRWYPTENINIGNNSEIFNIGWSGTSASFNFLVPLQSELNKFLNDYPDTKISIMSDRFPFELNELKSRINFIKWSPDSEVDFIRSLNVGLMPVQDDLWSRGKCAYKMLLYAACGIPVVVSPIGVNKTILEMAEIGYGAVLKGDWYVSLRELYNDNSKCQKFSENGIKLVNNNYSVKICAPKIANLLRQFT